MNQDTNPLIQNLLESFAENTTRDLSNNVWGNLIQSTVRSMLNRPMENTPIRTPQNQPPQNQPPQNQPPYFTETAQRLWTNNIHNGPVHQNNHNNESYTQLQTRQLNILSSLLYDYYRNIRDYQRNMGECIRILRNLRMNYLDNETFGQSYPANFNGTYTNPTAPTTSPSQRNAYYQNTNTFTPQQQQSRQQYEHDDTQYIFSYTLYPILDQRFAGQLNDEEPRILTREEISRSTRTYGYTDEMAADTDASNNVCPISLDTFSVGDVICEILGCRHIFKRPALMHWFRNHSSCPVCRYNLYNYVPTVRTDPSNNTVVENMHSRPNTPDYTDLPPLIPINTPLQTTGYDDIANLLAQAITESTSSFQYSLPTSTAYDEPDVDELN